MGYDLIPINKGVKSMRGYIFTWPMLLTMTGAGYLFGYGDNRATAGTFFYDEGVCPVSNDGLKVSAEDAVTIARLFKGFVSVERANKVEWEKLNDLQRKLRLSFDKRAEPCGERFLKEAETLADFCEKSGGFEIW